jgi:3-methylcrotonyl-CoA carboxylase alpha subunit
VRLAPSAPSEYAVTTVAAGAEMARRIRLRGSDGDDVVAEVDGRRLRATVARSGADEWWVRVAEVTHALRWLSPLRVPAATVSAPGFEHDSANGRRAAAVRRPGAVEAPMPGLVVAVLAEAGREVVAGEPVAVLEAMKVQQTIRAPHAGLVEAVHVSAGEQVRAGAALLDIRQPATAERGS